MRLLVIRHGESEADVLNVHEGRADFALTERGRRQAQAMSRYVSAHYNVCKIYHSTLIRAVQTARYLAGATGAALQPEEYLMEFDNGLIAGLGRDEADEKYPQVPVPPHASVYEQESALMFRYRAEFILSKILAENEADSTVAAVTHGGTINQLYRAFLRLPLDAGFSFYTDDTGLHEWLIVRDSRCVVKANVSVFDEPAP